MIDLSRNEAPYAPPAAVVAAMADVDPRLYPEARATALRDALAARAGVDPAGVLVTAGASDALRAVVEAATTGGAEALLVAPPTYPLPTEVATRVGLPVVALPRRDDLSIDVAAAVGAIATSPSGLVYLATPNNPTGVPEPDAAAEALGEACRARGSTLVVDRAYEGFDGAPSVADGSADHLTVRTFSKRFALAGCRLGWITGPPDRIAAVADHVLPFSVAAAAVSAGGAALRCEGEYARRAAEVGAARDRLASSLRAHGLVVAASAANFLHVDAADGRDVPAALAAAGIVSKPAWSRAGGTTAARVTIGPPAANTLVDEVLGAWARGEGAPDRAPGR